jgi:hypothetical protein
VARGKIAIAVGSIDIGVAEASQRLRMQPGAGVRKAAKDHAGDRRRRGQRFKDRRDRDRCRAIGGETVDPGGNGGKGNRTKAVGVAEFDGAAIARCQSGIFALAAAVPDRADGMNHVPRRQPIARRDFGIAGGAAVERAAFRKKLRPGRAMDRAIDTAAAEQRGVRGVDDGVNA